ncbi:MAG TPA: hypothetical protein VKB75_09595 [Jatrophihabitans sp.]|nr:hypothetical protein [Jatrophihabitans sp.]
MLSRFEVAKDTAQALTESAADHVGRIATIVSGAVREIAHEMGEWASDAFEMREAADKAAADKAAAYRGADAAADDAAARAAADTAGADDAGADDH